MQDLKARKSEIRLDTLARRNALSDKDRSEKSTAIMDSLFNFANFLEARTVLFYMNSNSEVATEAMIRKTSRYEKGIVLPWVDRKEKQIIPFKIDDLNQDVQPGYQKIREPIPQRCKPMPVEQIDLAIIPGIAFDERGSVIWSIAAFFLVIIYFR